MPAGEWPHSFSAIQALGLEFSQSENISAWHAAQTPHEIGKGTTTRSPTLRLCTSRPVSTTSPMNSWPRMSPFSTVGIYPSTRCRSEPQMAVEEMRTIASRALRICGSGTVSTLTVFRPIQTVAFICRPIPFACHRKAFSPGGHQTLNRPSSPRHGVVGRLRRVRAAITVDACVGVDDLAQLDDLLEAAQILPDLLGRLLTEEPGHGRAQLAAGRAVVERPPHLGGLPTRCRVTSDR